MGKIITTVDEDVKRQAAALYESMGMSLSTAINTFLRQSIADNGMPFKPTRRTPDGYPIPADHDGYTLERSKNTGHVILPETWDDPEDEIHDLYAQ